MAESHKVEELTETWLGLKSVWPEPENKFEVISRHMKVSQPGCEAVSITL